jgi:hypothetical protein
MSMKILPFVLYTSLPPGREVDHSPPTSAEVKKSGTIRPLPHSLHGVVLN